MSSKRTTQGSEGMVIPCVGHAGTLQTPVSPLACAFSGACIRSVQFFENVFQRVPFQRPKTYSCIHRVHLQSSRRKRQGTELPKTPGQVIKTETTGRGRKVNDEGQPQQRATVTLGGVCWTLSGSPSTPVGHYAYWMQATFTPGEILQALGMCV